MILQTFWRSFPLIYEHFSVQQVAPADPSIQTPSNSVKQPSSSSGSGGKKRITTHKSLGDLFDSNSSSSSNRMYLTEFCWYYLFPSLYSEYSTSIPVNSTTSVKAHTVPIKRLDTASTTTSVPNTDNNKEDQTIPATRITSVVNASLAIKPKDKVRSNRITPSIVSSSSPALKAFSSPGGVQSGEKPPCSTTTVVTSEVPKNVNASPSASSTTSVTSPPPVTPPTITRKALSSKTAINSTNSSTTSTPRKSRTPLTASNNNSSSINGIAKLISPSKSLSHTNLNKFNNYSGGSSGFGSLDQQQSTLRRLLFDQIIPESVLVPDFLQGNLMSSTRMIPPVVPEIKSRDLLQG